MDIEPVIDASAIVAYVTLEEYSEWVSQTIRNYKYFNILDLTYYEVSNAIKNKFREKKLSSAQATSAFNDATEFMDLCKLHTFKEVISNAMNEVIKLNLTSYDVA
jgi:predicted nucleic acid-binding protein